MTTLKPKAAKIIAVAVAALCGTLGLGGGATPQSDSGEFLLVRRSLTVQPVRQITVSEQSIDSLNAEKGWTTTRIADCIAIINPGATTPPRTAGLLLLADGQRLPGSVASDGEKAQPDTLAWDHPWLGRVDVPLKLIQSVLFNAQAVAPPPAQSDVVLFANGDRQEGLITALDGTTLSLETDLNGKRQTTPIPLRLVNSVTMVTPTQAPVGRRVWFAEGTVIDVQSVAIGADGYVRLTGSALASGSQSSRIAVAQVAGILFDPKGLVPLASLMPARIEGPATRFVLPKPHTADPDAALGLSSIDLRGPIVVRYTLPAIATGAAAGEKSTRHLAADAVLPRAAYEWGDYELVIRSNDDEVFRARLNAANPRASINVAVPGRELTIELTAGAHGPIQDHLTLVRPMLLGK